MCEPPGDVCHPLVAVCQLECDNHSVDLTWPFRLILAPGTAAVLKTLAGTRAGLTGRVVADLSGLSPNGGSKVVWTEPAGRAILYRLNRDHIFAEPLLQLLSGQQEFRRRLATAIKEWRIPPVHVSLFGSMARGESHPTSDVDLLVVRPDEVVFDDPVWRTQLSALSDSAHSWTGHFVTWLELSAQELADAVGEEAIVDEWRRDGVHLGGGSLDALISGTAVPG